MFLAGVTVGDPVLRTGKPLSVELGPGKVALPVALRHKLLHVLLCTVYACTTMHF